MKCIVKLVIFLTFLLGNLFPSSSLAAVCTATNSATLISAINSNNSGTCDNNTIIIPSGTADFSLSGSLPVSTAVSGLTVCYSSSASSCVDPGTRITINGANNRMFVTANSGLSLQNLILTGGLAEGASPSSGGGGGGLGAGGAVYVDAGQSLSLTNTQISGCVAKGGNGGAGAGFTTTSAGGNASFFTTGIGASASSYTGYTVTAKGSGGAGGSIGLGAAGAGGGVGTSGGGTNGGNANVANYDGGNGSAGGYFGGGGGGGSGGCSGLGSRGAGGGGSGGIAASAGGIKGGATANDGGTGGAYGAGGGAGPNSVSGTIGGGGGGGFGGGGGGGNQFNCGTAGGGGGGWGAGGGGGGQNGSGAGTVGIGGQGGSYGGNGGNGDGSFFGATSGGGGGGAGIGGAVFVAQGATLTLNGGSIGGANTVAGFGGNGGTVSSTGSAGTAWAPDIFLMPGLTGFGSGALLTINGSSDQTVGSIDTDQNNASANIDRGVTLNTSGTTTFNGTSYTYKGGTRINDSGGGPGTLVINDDTQLGTAPSSPTTNLTFNGGALRNTASFSLNLNRTILINSNGAIFSPATGTTLSIGAVGQITGSGNLTVNGPGTGNGTVEITSFNVGYTGSALTMQNGGVLSISSLSSLGNGSNITSMTFNNGTLATLNTISSSAAISLNGGSSGGATFQPATATSITLSGALTGTGGITLNGGALNSTLILSNVGNNYSGATTITTGTLQTNAQNVIPSTSSVTLANSATAAWNLNNFNQSIATLSGGGGSGGNISLGSASLSINATAPGTYGGAISGTGGLTFAGSNTNTLTLSGTNTYSGTTTISAGTLLAGSSGAIPANSVLTINPVNPTTAQLSMQGNSLSVGTLTGTSTATINLGSTPGTTLTVTQASPTTYAGSITGTGNFTFSGSGVNTLTLSGNNSYTGTTTISAGTILAGSATAIPNTPLTINPVNPTTAQLSMQGNSLSVGTLTGTSTATINLGSTPGTTLSVTQTSPATYAGVISGTGNLTFSGSNVNTLTLSGANTYNGTTTINAGTLIASAANSLPAGGNITIAANATLNLGAPFSNSATIDNSGTISGSALTNSGTLELNNNASVATSVTNSGTITSSGTVTISNSVTNTGTLELVSGQLTVNSYTSSANPSSNMDITIVDSTNSGNMTSTGAMNLTNSSITVNLAAPVGGGRWLVLESAPGQLTPTSNITLPSSSSSLFGTWDYEYDAATFLYIILETSLTEHAIGPLNQSIAAALQAMSDLPNKNSGQTQLLNAIMQATTVDQYNDYLQQLAPNMNITTPSIFLQDKVFLKVERRLARLHGITLPGLDLGISTGDVCPSTSMWATGFGSFSRQAPFGENFGYRSKSFGTIVGVDTKLAKGGVFGLGIGLSKSIVYEYIEPHNNATIYGYHLLGYGTNFYNCGNFLEWLLTGAVTDSRGSRQIIISNEVMSTTSEYHGGQGAIRLNYGRNFEFGDIFSIAPIATAQYVLSYAPDYEEAYSVAALNVSPNNWQNVLTLGAGLRLDFPFDDWWLCGTREIRVGGTYDVISSDNSVAASFVVGSPDFQVNIAPPERWAFKTGIDLGFSLGDHLKILFTYDYELRVQYYDHSVALKLKLLF